MINTHITTFAMMGQGSGEACVPEQQSTLQKTPEQSDGNCEDDESDAGDDSDGNSVHFSPLKKPAVSKTRTKKEWQLVSA